MPVVVDLGYGNFKYLEDGKPAYDDTTLAPDDPRRNIVTVDAKNFPADKRYMLDPSYDGTKLPNAHPQQGGSSPASGGSRSGGRTATRMGGAVTPDVLRDGSQARSGATVPSQGGRALGVAAQSPTTFDPATTPLVQLTGNSAWNEYTPPGETAPRVSGGAQGQPSPAAYGAEPTGWRPFADYGMNEPLFGEGQSAAGATWNALAGGPQSQESYASMASQPPRGWDYYDIAPVPVGRPTTGDLLQQQYAPSTLLPDTMPMGSGPAARMGPAVGRDVREQAAFRASLAGDPALDQWRAAPVESVGQGGRWGPVSLNPWYGNEPVTADVLRGNYNAQGLAGIPSIPMVIPSYRR